MLEKLYARPFPRNGESCARCPTLRDSRSPLCDQCRAEQRRSVVRSHHTSDRAKSTAKAYLARTKDKQAAYQRRYREKHGERIRPLALARVRAIKFREGLVRHGLTEEQYHAMSAQGCRLCGGQDTSGKRLSMDHDHATGKFRGLLCGTCNTRLGWFERRRKAIEEYTA